MRLVLSDRSTASRFFLNFYPLALCRPIWELRCGMTSLAEKLIAKVGASDVVGFVPDYMAETYREQSGWTVNDPASLGGDDLLLVDARVKAESFNVEPGGPSRWEGINENYS